MVYRTATACSRCYSTAWRLKAVGRVVKVIGKHVLRPGQSGHAVIMSSTKRESNRALDQIHKTVDVDIHYSDEVHLNPHRESEDDPVNNYSSDFAQSVRRR